MTRMQVCLLGTFRASADELPLAIDSFKTKELFAHLLLHHDRLLDREALAGVLWGDVPTAQARKHLRQALWQLQSLLAMVGLDPPLLRVSDNTISLGVTDTLRVDALELERAFLATKGIAPREFDALLVDRVRQAVDLYQGELLEGWYSDWCLHPRERLQALFLSLLDKIMVHCELSGSYDVGIYYGMEALRHDPVRELTHLRLMRLHYCNGDRTMALRQYEQCATLLDQELGISPARATLALHRQIRLDERGSVSPEPGDGQALPDLLRQVEQMQAALADLRRHLLGTLSTQSRSPL